MVHENNRNRRILFGTAQLKQKIEFTKVQSIGNDFPLINLNCVREEELPALAEAMADRKFGVGGDGLLAYVKWQNGIKLRMFNPDGTEDFCGNGLRCAAWAAYKQGWVTDSFSIDHHGQIVPIQVRGSHVQTVLGKGDYTASRIPVQFEFEPDQTYHRAEIITVNGKVYAGSTVTTGSTHVILRPGLPLNEAEFISVSQSIENSSAFPERTSVIWRERVDEDVVSIRIWERGVGETLGCGTGSAAVAVELMREREHGGRIEVRNPGGSVWVEARDWQGPLTVIGEAQLVYEGVFEWAPRERSHL